MTVDDIQTRLRLQERIALIESRLHPRHGPRERRAGHRLLTELLAAGWAEIHQVPGTQARQLSMLHVSSCRCHQSDIDLLRLWAAEARAKVQALPAPIHRPLRTAAEQAVAV